MDEVSILLTLYSVVAGLGISRLVQGVSDMIKSRADLRFDWVHTGWVCIIFLSHIVTWFALMRFAKGAHWTVFNAVLALMVPILLYVVSDLVVPRFEGDDRFDLGRYFDSNARWLLGLMLAAVACTFVVQVAVERRTDIAGGGALRLACALVLAAGVVSSSRRTHRIVTVAMLVVLVSGAALVSVRLMQ